MIVCVCNNLDDKKIKELEDRFSKKGCLAALANKENCCGACIKYLKSRNNLTECRSCDIIKDSNKD